MDRRARFFLVAAVICLVLVPVADQKFRWVPMVTAAAYILLAAAVILESLSKRRNQGD